ncbi:hypothetical protein LIER_04749 [Lithospermum erythrorhizon]|uniref:Uncharacterized protein n=1 Tax=Lithospermum erythrorhizon TaxID=34254 RepID=A0AAV3P2L6_LITER
MKDFEPGNQSEENNFVNLQEELDEGGNEDEEEEEQEVSDNLEDDSEDTETLSSSNEDDNPPPPSGSQALIVNQEIDKDSDEEDTNYIVDSPIKESVPLMVLPPPPVDTTNFYFDTATFLELLSENDDESIDNDELSFTKISQWLDEPNYRWIETLSTNVNINSHTLEQILYIHINFFMQASFEEDEALTQVHQKIDMSGIRQIISNELIALAGTIHDQIDKYPNLGTEEAQIMIQRLHTIAGFPSEEIEDNI